MRILVCGSRTFANAEQVERALDGARHIFGRPLTTLVHGAAAGADALAARWAAQYDDIDVAAFPADWSRYGKSAGPRRNMQMLEEGKPDAVMAFVDKPLEKSKGTAHMVSISLANHLPVAVIHVPALTQGDTQ